MLRNYSCYEGQPARLYRHPSEIAEDIERISERIGEVNAQLNVRALTMDMLSECDGKSLSRDIERIEDIVARAREGLEELRAMSESLDELRCELCESRWIHRR